MGGIIGEYIRNIQHAGDAEEDSNLLVTDRRLLASK